MQSSSLLCNTCIYNAVAFPVVQQLYLQCSGLRCIPLLWSRRSRLRCCAVAVFMLQSPSLCAVAVLTVQPVAFPLRSICIYVAGCGRCLPNAPEQRQLRRRLRST